MRFSEDVLIKIIIASIEYAQCIARIHASRGASLLSPGVFTLNVVLGQRLDLCVTLNYIFVIYIYICIHDDPFSSSHTRLAYRSYIEGQFYSESCHYIIHIPHLFTRLDTYMHFSTPILRAIAMLFRGFMMCA